MNSGWYVPLVDTTLDYNNSTSDWHRIDAQGLSQGVVQVGLLLDGKIDLERISALSNITEDSLLKGLGIDDGFSLYIQIKIIESENTSRSRPYPVRRRNSRNSESPSSASVTFQDGGDKIQLI